MLHTVWSFMSAMPPVPNRDAAPPDGGQGLLQPGQEPPAPVEQPDQQQTISGKLQLFRSADEMISNISRASPMGGKYGEAIKQLLKKWMMDEVAAQRTSTGENPRILGA